QEGLEPPRPCEHQILSLTRLPVPPLGPERMAAHHSGAAFSINAVSRRATTPSGMYAATPPARGGLSLRLPDHHHRRIVLMRLVRRCHRGQQGFSGSIEGCGSTHDARDVGLGDAVDAVAG